jgi:hypothetical protein
MIALEKGEIDYRTTEQVEKTRCMMNGKSSMKCPCGAKTICHPNPNTRSSRASKQAQH